ncbi:MAG: SDR family NAD(P)-dependent oxidoreductase [Acidimicrobiia bacterium]
MNDHKLRGRIGMVTGAGRGLGRAVAGGLAKAGAKVAIVDIDESSAKHAAEEIESMGPVVPIVADCSDSEGIERAFEAAESEWDHPVDALVNNAGVLSFELANELTDSEIERVLRVNLMGPMLTTREFARRLMAAGSPGAIVNITSTTAHVASLPRLSAYAASKGGLLAFTRGAAADLARHSIRVNAVSPGWMQTDMSAALDERQRELRGRIPLRRATGPEELVPAIVFLLSDEASYIDATCLAIDGGWMGY